MTFGVRWFPATSETFILRQITELLELGHDIRIAADRKPEFRVEHREFETYSLDDRTTYALQENSPSLLAGVHGLASAARLVLRYPGSLSHLFRSPSDQSGGRRLYLARLAALVRLGLPDILHCHFGDIGLQYVPISEALDLPLVVSFYGYDCSRFPREHSDDVYVPLFDRASAVIVLSEQMRDQLIQLGCPQNIIHKVHLGVDPSEFSFHPRRGPREGEPTRILTVARLVEKKGIPYALEALAKIRDRTSIREGTNHDVRYDIVGDGPLRARLEERAKELSLQDIVCFHGSQSQAYVRSAMERAHIFLLPSVTATNGDQEGTPTVLVEASSTGLPVVATRHSGIPEIVLDHESGYLVPERDSDALAESLDLLLSQPNTWATFGTRGRRHIEQTFDQRRLSQQLSSLYSQIY